MRSHTCHRCCVSTGLLQVVKQYVKIPVYVMIRPRGGDFLYSDQEVQVMRKDIELMKEHGADGLVLGALTEDGRVDSELCMELLGNVSLSDVRREESETGNRTQTLASQAVRQGFPHLTCVLLEISLNKCM